MIVTRAPVRIPLGGGGTDLSTYYSRNGGALVSAAIDKHIYVLVNHRFESSIRVGYSINEIVETVDEIQHPLVREALKLLGISNHLEIVTVSDIPSNTGLGTSSAFCVALLLAIHTYKNEMVERHFLAEEAYHLEHDVLGEPVGKQDQYIAAYGGVTTLDIEPDGKVAVGRIAMDATAVEDFERNCLMFFTGITRRAGDVLRDQHDKAADADAGVLERLDAIKAIGHEVRTALRVGDSESFGRLMHRHWEVKRGLSSGVSNSHVDALYDAALRTGALGGKLMGAGGGGFLLLHTGNSRKEVRRTMNEMGAHELRYKIDPHGARVLFHV